MKYLKLFLILLIFTVTTAFGQTKKNNFEITKSIDIYNNVLRQLNMHYVDEINPAELNEAAINAMLEGLDPYTVFIPESQIEDVKLMTTGEYGGIGATIQYFENKVQIAEPYEGFPAAKAGLIPGDVFLEVNGIDVTDKTSSEVSELLKGTPGTTLKLKMQRLGEKEPIVKELKREKIKIDNIPYYTVFDNGVGYAILSQFTKDCAKELKDVFMEMKKQNPELKGFILDLRGNGGGLLNEAVDIVNMFVPKNKLVVYQKGKLKDQNYNHFTQHEPLDLDIPLVVLVNEGSASASEIVSGSIQDFDRGVIVGQRTFGKGLVQNILPMNYNTQIKVTVAHYYLPSNRCIQEIDYSKKNKKNANDTLTVNDTLGQPFHTANGRVVYEGHGIQPDVKIEPELMSTITTHLYAKNLFFKYANKFYSKHKSIKSPKEFKITDETYDDFMQFVKDEGFTFTSKSEEDIKALEKTAKAEGYLDEIKPILDQAVARIEEEKTKDLVDNRSEIEQLMRYEIVSRYYYQKGRIIATLEDDPELKKAFEVILNQEEYNNILKGTK